MKTKKTCRHCNREFEAQHGTNAFHQAVRGVPGFHPQARYIMAACARTLKETQALREGVETMATTIKGLSQESAAYLLASIGLLVKEMEAGDDDGNRQPGDLRE